MRTLTAPSEASAIPLTKQDCQALDDMFNSVDLQQLTCLEAFFKGAFVPQLDPLEKPAWMAGSSSSVMGNFIDCGY
ncbi:hypothetical protein [Kamptonema formosum]|uniref:hypothetical protein n=1 Tax=Kamptonema formosum TaxID=331992 RepID=UPI0003457C4E|nr:hypothetical protein [Oscillatoria sp. PCC 10802]